MSDVIDAGAEHERHRNRPRGQEPEEVLRRQIRGERAAVGSAVRALAGQVPDGGAGRDEFQAALTPGVHLHPQLHADDAVGAEVIGLGLHAGHRELARVVHGLGEDLEFLVLVPPADLQADVVDRGADDEAERLEAGLAEQHVLRHRQIGGEHAGRAGTRGLREPGIGSLRLPGPGRLVLRTGKQRHGASPECGMCRLQPTAGAAGGLCVPVAPAARDSPWPSARLARRSAARPTLPRSRRPPARAP